jgi:hypothetical protein
LNPRPPGYEPGELPDCSTPRRVLQTPLTRADTPTDARTVWANPRPWYCEVRINMSRSNGSVPRAGNGTRTRDPNLGKVVLYQLSYSRDAVEDFSVRPAAAQRPVLRGVTRSKRGHGGEGDRTPDLVNAIHALSQLSYAPDGLSRFRTALRQHGNVARALSSVNAEYTAPHEATRLNRRIFRQP